MSIRSDFIAVLFGVQLFFVIFCLVAEKEKGTQLGVLVDSMEADNAAEDLAKSPILFKAKSDIAKSMAKNFLKTRKATGTSEVRRRKPKKKNKSVLEGNKATEDNANKLNSRKENQQEDATTSTECVEKS
ncbi:uncharacterized protein LOC111277052 isoform X2 [Durio zibethinus]|uniref:Uncharacterized protein LOC111277052 isoform X2 n=1 Tax=Durio zibethinus TaxID=66656 RepID=A0A6P5WS42_DURZI|nr:uncharacterized protein LOC111277052 isoform X2 [Durio zibethinus]